jgi:hypothetical protein
MTSPLVVGEMSLQWHRRCASASVPMTAITGIVYSCNVGVFDDSTVKLIARILSANKSSSVTAPLVFENLAGSSLRAADVHLRRFVWWLCSIQTIGKFVYVGNFLERSVFRWLWKTIIHEGRAYWASRTVFYWAFHVIFYLIGFVQVVTNNLMICL